MAKIVIAGSSNCPKYAKVELLADNLMKNLPNFKVNKIVKKPQEWELWLKEICVKQGFKHSASPLIWRELVNRGGKGVLIGGANEFQEYVKAYYGIDSTMKSEEMKQVATDNVSYKEEIDAEYDYVRSLSHPMQICITNANSITAYQAIPIIAEGSVFGQKTELSLVLYGASDQQAYLKGVQMEIYDMAYALVHNVTITDNLKAALQDCEVVIILDDVEHLENESREQWLLRHEPIFRTYANAIDSICKLDTKVVVAGNGPNNLCAAIMLRNYTKMQRYNTVALGRYLERQAKNLLAKQMNVNSANVIDLTIWGNPSGVYHAHLPLSRVYAYDGAIVGPIKTYSQFVEDIIWDKKWLANEFPSLLASRRDVICGNLGHSCGISQAESLTDFLCQWWNSSPKNEMFSLGVCSEGYYNVPKDMVFSFPVNFSPRGYWSLVQDIELTPELTNKIKSAVEDLTREFEIIYPPPKIVDMNEFEITFQEVSPAIISRVNAEENEKNSHLEKLRIVVETEFSSNIDYLLSKLQQLSLMELQQLTSDESEESLKLYCVQLLNSGSEITKLESIVEKEPDASGAGRKLGGIQEEEEIDTDRPVNMENNDDS